MEGEPLSLQARKLSCEGSENCRPQKKCRKHLLLKHQSLVFTKDLIDSDEVEEKEEANDFFNNTNIEDQANLKQKMSSTSANGTERPKTADLMDLEPSDAQIANDIFKNYGGSKRFFGQIETVRCFENNPLVRQTLSTPGMGRVLVVDGGGSLRYALMGDQLGALACENDWQGVIINGCVRDSEELSQMAVGVKALGTHPQKSKKDIPGEKGIPVCFAGVRFIPGQWLYADLDGIIVAKEQIHTGLASKM